MTGRALKVDPKGPCRHQGGPWILLLAAFLVAWISTTSAQIIFNPTTVNARKGADVTLTPQVTLAIQYYNWFQGDATSIPNLIFGYFLGRSPPINYGSKYTGRESGLQNGGMKISNLLQNYTGKYTIQMQLVGQSLQQGTVQLFVSDGAVPSSPFPLMTLIFGLCSCLS
ncbi:carcinoembryonic antigen-related cell adhesion molecule 6-like [Ambystoma mexicanum]|uniref:carcinoembryonic antigen-related cell adhesion molecule 6-like n=1 Tax=Ambystoma mexicanum TaxID=8296 RepID=UPI0037E82D37